MLQADLCLFLLFYHKSRFAGVFILVFSAHLFASCGVVWYEKKRLPPFSGAALLKIQAKYDRLTAELHALERERKQCQADALMDALSKSGKTLDDVLIFLGR